ncbi:Type II secretion system (T2SS)-related protein GspEL2 [Andalucia godoyi]|uniref:Type II secretion system (T2SS)-related protein GspEL2 n=1 Tax=Andalucia godoyi TaxID=505711 RepID=A0A8K0AHR4_ANDGO|nr:Type II secretion system (T2SS)-related protein GspEL2 [Andalucia godoyi]|eukprot:ANDGO_05919.mRNA.1 Type II secretion system (T2SS)-related protein GspEL2
MEFKSLTRLSALFSHLREPSIASDSSSRVNPSVDHKDLDSEHGLRSGEPPSENAESGVDPIDELDELIRRAEEIRRLKETQRSNVSVPVSDDSFDVDGGESATMMREMQSRLSMMFTPYLVVPTFVEESAKSGLENRERRRKRVSILYDVSTSRAQQPVHLDVSVDDPKTPKAFGIIRTVLLAAEARNAQDVHWDQHSARAVSVIFTTPLGITKRVVIKGPVVQSIIYYLGFHDLVSANKGMPGPVRDYALKIKLRTHDLVHGTHHLYRVNCIRTNHELGFYHIVMRLLQN